MCGRVCGGESVGGDRLRRRLSDVLTISGFYWQVCFVPFKRGLYRLRDHKGSGSLWCGWGIGDKRYNHAILIL